MLCLDCFVFSATPKDKRSKRKTFLSIFLFDHLHRPIFTCVIERQTQQEKNVSFNFPFGSSSPPRFYRRYRKTNAATEKCFFQFSFLTIFTALSLHALSKDKRSKRKTFLSISLFVHLHRPVFTSVIVKDIMQLIVKIEFFYLYIKNKPRRLSGLCNSLADFPL